MVTKSEWVQWKHNDVTKEMLKAMMDKRETVKEALVRGGVPLEINQGYCQAILDMYNYAVEDFEVREDTEVEEPTVGGWDD